VQRCAIEGLRRRADVRSVRKCEAEGAGGFAGDRLADEFDVAVELPFDVAAGSLNTLNIEDRSAGCFFFARFSRTASRRWSLIYCQSPFSRHLAKQ